VAVDGKARRRSFEDAAARSPPHLVQAFSTQVKLVLGQVEVDPGRTGSRRCRGCRSCSTS
jgi:hypothetical protein